MRSKIVLIIGIILSIVCLNVNAQENMKFDSEAKKLDFIRQMLSKEKNLRIADDAQYTHPQYCSVMMKDLLTGKNFKAIEPDVKAESMDDPRLEKCNQCRGRDYHDFNVDPELFFGWLPQFGAPPYRYYRIELDGNPKNGPEDMIYAEYSDELSYVGTSSYTWVNLSKCEIQKGGGFVASSPKLYMFSKKPNPVCLNTLVYYKGKLWAADFVGGFNFRFSRWVDDRSRMEICYWHLLQSKKSE
jgi:hypothetical protein